MIRVVDNVPLPDNIERRRSRRPRGSKYPFGDMQIGNSFFIKNKAAVNMHASMAQAERTLGCRFIARDVTGGCRIWRIE